MDDNAVLNRIGKLADEELELEESHAESPLSTEQKQRLKAIEVELDSEPMKARLYYLRNRTGKAAVAIKEKEKHTGSEKQHAEAAPAAT